MADYDWPAIERRRADGETWPEIAEDYGVTPGTIRKAYSRYTGGASDASTETLERGGISMPAPESDGMNILGIDIETAPHKVYVWGTRKQYINTDQMIESGRVMCFSARWFSEPDSRTIFVSEHEHGHKPMILAAWALLDEADAVVHYNGSKFDVPMLNREFIKYDINPPATFKEVDLLKTARRRFKFNTNKLDNVLDELDIGRKVKHEGFEMWVKCMEEGDEDAWERMELYNRNDVDQMEDLYYRLLPWISRHPNHALYMASLDRPTCPNCGGSKLHSKGYRRTKTQKYRRFQCQDCGTYVRERYTAVTKEDRDNILVQA